jgi:diketogulonate reductase-like aldo/keto reductase
VNMKRTAQRIFSLRNYCAGNENEVGEGIKDSGVPREEIFLTSKLWNTDQPNVEEGLKKSLEALGTDYLDLYVCAPHSHTILLSLLSPLGERFYEADIVD